MRYFLGLIIAQALLSYFVRGWGQGLLDGILFIPFWIANLFGSEIKLVHEAIGVYWFTFVSGIAHFLWIIALIAKALR